MQQEQRTYLENCREWNQRNHASTNPVLLRDLKEGQGDKLSEDEHVQRVSESAAEDDPSLQLVPSPPEDVRELVRKHDEREAKVGKIERDHERVELHGRISCGMTRGTGTHDRKDCRDGNDEEVVRQPVVRQERSTPCAVL